MANQGDWCTALLRNDCRTVERFARPSGMTWLSNQEKMTMAGHARFGVERVNQPFWPACRPMRALQLQAVARHGLGFDEVAGRIAYMGT